MIQVNLSDEIFAKLQRLAIPLVDTAESVINRVLDNELARQSQGLEDSSVNVIENDLNLASIMSISSVDSLTHTMLLSASFNGISPDPMSWKQLAEVAHIESYRLLGSFDAFRQATKANVKQGKFEERGYRFVPSINVSIQGVSANAAWESIYRLAQKTGVHVEVVFEWRDKADAAHAGKTRRLFWSPPSVRSEGK